MTIILKKERKEVADRQKAKELVCISVDWSS
jgi:hypothetical protein